MADVALYHPWIEPTDASMLRTAALFWDRLLTIVPEAIEEPYQNAVAKEAAELGFLQPRRITSELPEVQRASEEFAADRHRSVIRKARRAQRLQWDRMARLHRGKVALLHRGKVTGEIAEQLFGSANPEGFFQVTRSDGAAYMSKLASLLADADQITPFTDCEEHQDILRDRFCDETDPGRECDALCEIARLSLRTVAIRDDVSLRSVIEFRNANGDLLRNYRGSVSRLAREISRTTSDEEKLRTRIAEVVREEIAPSIDELEAKLREGRFLSGLSYLDLGQSCSIGLISSGADNWQMGVLGGLVTLGISLFRSRHETQSVIRNAPYGYLLRVRERFSRQRDSRR